MQADSLAGLLRALDMAPAVIVGGSGGARVSLLTAARHPDAAAKLAMLWISGGVYGLMLLATHYCAAGNQPHMRLDPKASTSDLYVFAFDGGTNFDPAKDTHIHSMRLAFKGDHLESEWAALAGGQPAPAQKFVLSRK